MPRVVYTPEIKRFIAENVAGVKNKDLTRMVNEKFGTNISENSIASYKNKHGLKSGLDFYSFCRKKGDPPNATSWKKGHISHNKGKKGLKNPGSEKGWFKKGTTPKNWRPVGTERVRGDGYVWIKVAEPNKWRQKQRVVWEEAFGPIPQGMKIIYKDKNRQNVTLENMMLVTDAQMAILHGYGMYKQQPELTEAGVGVAKLLDAINKANDKVREAEDGKHR